MIHSRTPQLLDRIHKITNTYTQVVTAVKVEKDLLEQKASLDQKVPIKNG